SRRAIAPSSWRPCRLSATPSNSSRAEAAMPGLIGDLMRPGQGAAPGQEPDMQPAGIRTEYPFVLPRGYVDEQGTIHREGVMRLATARDEITTQTDPRVRQNPAYLTVLLLSRTITRIGQVKQ